MNSDAQSLIADAIVDTDLLGETIGYLADGASSWVDIPACVERDPTEPTDGDVQALELRPVVHIRKADAPALKPGKDQVRFEWGGEQRVFRVDRHLSEDEGSWHVEVVL